MDINPEQLEEFTHRPLLAILATMNPHGAPRAMPVYYEYYNGTFNITSYANLFKERKDSAATFFIPEKLYDW